MVLADNDNRFNIHKLQKLSKSLVILVKSPNSGYNSKDFPQK